MNGDDDGGLVDKKDKVDSEVVRAAVAAVEKARNYYQNALVVSQKARHEETAALNALNGATKKFDELLTEFRRTVPQGADWNRPEMVGAGR